jgi:hypothetical protein
MKTAREKIQDGDYENKEGYPDHKLKKNNPDVYRELKRQWWEEEGRINTQFRSDLEEEYGMTNHPIKDQLFALAWEQGHGSGYSEVVNYYEDFRLALIVPMNAYIKETFGVQL